MPLHNLALASTSFRMAIPLGLQKKGSYTISQITKDLRRKNKHTFVEFILSILYLGLYTRDLGSLVLSDMLQEY